MINSRIIFYKKQYLIFNCFVNNCFVNKFNFLIVLHKKTINILFLSLFLFSDNCYAYETGGSNYISYDLNGYDYKAFKKGVEWHEKIKTVVGHYHENTNAVIQQLTNMRKAGQEKIAFVIWHGRLDPSVKNQRTRL